MTDPRKAALDAFNEWLKQQPLSDFGSAKCEITLRENSETIISLLTSPAPMPSAEIDTAVRALKARSWGYFEPDYGDGEKRAITETLKAALASAAMGVENEKMREALSEAAAQFHLYEALHRAKPDHVKADVNLHFAQMCEKALTQPGEKS